MFEGEQSIAEVTPTVSQQESVVSESSEKVAATESVYPGSVIARLKEKQKMTGRPFTALFTDIDNTFYRSDRKEASKTLVETADLGSYPIIAVTGNSIEAVRLRIGNGELPKFAAIASSVGTEIWVLTPIESGLKDDGEGNLTYVKDQAFDDKLQQNGYDRQAVAKLGDLLVNQLAKTDPSAGLTFQKPEQEEAFLAGEIQDVEKYKTSFYFYASSPEDQEVVLSQMRERYPGQQIVACEEIGYNSRMIPGDSRKKYCVDVLPITKAGSVSYLSEQMQVEVGIVAGDSGNDTEMLTGSGDISLAVGGAKPELKETIEEIVSGGGGQGSFKSIENKLYYREKNGDRLGPDSILRAAKILERFQRRFRTSSPVAEPVSSSDPV